MISTLRLPGTVLRSSGECPCTSALGLFTRRYSAGRSKLWAFSKLTVSVLRSLCRRSSVGHTGASVIILHPCDGPFHTLVDGRAPPPPPSADDPPIFTQAVRRAAGRLMRAIAAAMLRCESFGGDDALQGYFGFNRFCAVVDSRIDRRAGPAMGGTRL